MPPKLAEKNTFSAALLRKKNKFSKAVAYSFYVALATLSSVPVFRGLSLQPRPSDSTKQFVLLELGFDWGKVEPASELNWVECYQGRQCARLEVPLDYTDPTGDKAAIALLRVKAKVSHRSDRYRGPVLFNPGGPGGSGVRFIDKLGDKYQNVLGDEYDIIGFDPRGVEETTPKLSVFADPWERAYWASKASPLINSSDDALPKSYARAQLLGELMDARSRHTAEHVSTAVVARDMFSITKAHGRDRLLYWGFSYGTTLGATYAAMFPNNIERLVIDGVVDVEDYYSGTWSESLHDTDKVLQYFYDACAEASPSDCPLHANSSALVQNKVEAVFASIKASPLPVFNGTDYDIIDYKFLKTALFRALLKPFTSLRVMAHALACLEEGDGRSAMAAIHSLKEEPMCTTSGLIPSPQEAGLAVRCGEAANVHRDIPSITNVFENLSKLSVFADVWTDGRLSCSGWKVMAKDIFSGPFVTTPEFPLLIIGNTADPVTPLRGARKAANYFNGSTLLTINTPGHCSEAATSLCATKHIRNYFRLGDMPEEGTICEIEDVLFGTNSEDAHALDAEDQALLDVSRQLAQSFHAAREMYLM